MKRKLLTNKEIIEMLEKKIKTYEYFFKMSEKEYLAKFRTFERELAALASQEPAAINEDSFYNQDWSSNLKTKKEGA